MQKPYVDTAANRQGTLPDWDAIRSQFPTTGKLTFLNSGMKALLPRSVAEAMQEWIEDVYESGGEKAFAMAEIEKTRAAVAATFGAPADCISLIKNTAEGIGIMAQGFPWRPGDNVVISDIEHETNTFPWRYLKSRGVETRFAKPDGQGRVTLECYRPLVDRHTRVLALAWVAYGNGYRADLAAVGAFCRERGIKLVVDGIQAVGVLATPISELGVDALVAGGHKAQFSLTGAGFMYTAPDLRQMIMPQHVAKFSFRSNDRFQPELELAEDGHRFEYGNPNFLGCFVQRRSAEFVRRIGLDHIEARVRALTTRLIDGALARQIRVRTPIAWEERAGLVSFEFRTAAEPIVARLKQKSIIVSEKDGHVRAGVLFYNNEADIDRFLDAMTEL
jgi:cysteine desulfurase / selenocysteine lyase